MYTMYKDGEEATVEREQLELMKKAGWSETAPVEESTPEVSEEEAAALAKAAEEAEATKIAAAAKQQAKEDAASAKGKGKI